MDGIVEGDDDRDQTVGREDESGKESDGEQTPAWLRNDVLDGSPDGNVGVVGKYTLDESHQLDLKIIDGDVGNQGKEEDDGRENCQNEIKGNGGGSGRYSAIHDALPEKECDIVKR